MLRADLNLLFLKHFHREEFTQRPKLDEASRNCPRKGRLSGWSYRLTVGQVPWAALSHGRVGVPPPRSWIMSRISCLVRMPLRSRSTTTTAVCSHLLAIASSLTVTRPLAGVDGFDE